MRKLIYDSYKKVSELVLPPHTTSSFKRDGVRRGSNFNVHKPLCANESPQRPASLSPSVCVCVCVCVCVRMCFHGLICLQRLTGDEFVAAGDFLVRACPTWVW
jgi:hypothetical protein